MNAGDKLRDTVKSIDFNQVFVIDDNKGKSYTYGRFFCECMKLAIDIEKEFDCESIVAVLENGYSLFKLYFVAMLANKEIIVIDPLKGADEIKEIILGIKQGILVHEENINFDNKRLIRWEKNTVERYETNTDFIDKDIILELLKKVDLYKTYLTTFTSGTSGVTKGVRHSLNSLLSTAIAFQNASSRGEGGCFFHFMPMTYMAGILNSIFLPFMMKQKIVLGKRFGVKTAITFWQKAIKYKADTFWLSPTMLTLIEKVDRSKAGEDYCRQRELCFWVGTAALTEKVRLRFESRYGVEVNASYGLSETLFVSVENDWTRKISEKNSVGKLLKGVQYRIEEDGEFLLYVPWMYQGYTNENDEMYFQGKYYKTGDLVQIKDEILYITGRKKDLIIKGGLNLSPALIEEYVNQVENVCENAVFGLKNALGEEVVCCAYVIEKTASALEIESTINKKVISGLGKNYKIDVFLKVRELPRNINGKIDKNQLKKMGIRNDNKV